MLSAAPIIYGLIFVGVLVFVNGIYLVAFGKSISLSNKVNRRLEMLDRGDRREDVLAKLRKEMDQHMKSRGLPLYSLLADRAQKAALAFTPNQLILMMAGVSAFAFFGLTAGTEAGLGVRVMIAIGLACSPKLLIAGAQIGDTQIIGDGSVKQQRVLESCFACRSPRRGQPDRSM